MTDTAAPPTDSTVDLAQVDPTVLVLPLEGNVRKDTKLDKHFLASVKNHGILHPPLVMITGDGEYEVLDGQRRTLAAVQAGLPTIPVLIVATRADRDRIADQLIVNDQRAPLTDVEHTTAYQQLALFGLTAAEISRRTATPIARVGDNLKVARTPAAKEALESGLNLAHAIVIAEFADDPAAVKKLTTTAEQTPEKFDHLAEQLRGAALRETEKRALVDQIHTAGWRYLDTHPEYGSTEYTNITRLALAASPTVPLTAEDVAQEPGLAAAVYSGYVEVDGSWRSGSKITYYLPVDPEQRTLDVVPLAYAGHQLGSDTADLDPEAQRAHEAEQQRIATAHAAETAATVVRRAFITELLQRAVLPADAINYIAWSTVTDGDGLVAFAPEVTTALDLGGDQRPHDALIAALERRPKLALTVTLGLHLYALDAWVEQASTEYPLDPREATATRLHLEQLRAWGYTLSDAETALLTAAGTDTTPAPEITDDEGDDA